MPWTATGTEPPPDPGLTRAFVDCLPGGRFAGPLLAFASLASTQTMGRALAAHGAGEGTVVLADYQTAGRGRRGGVWVAAPGTALLFSCVLRPPIETARWPEVTVAAGIAVAEAVEGRTGLAARLKWPNDVLVDGRKIAGLLAEGIVGEDRFIILGVGVNVLQRPVDWPPELASRATSLAALGVPVPRELLLTGILARLAVRYEELLSRGFAPVREAWQSRAAAGEPVLDIRGDAVADSGRTGTDPAVRRADTGDTEARMGSRS